MNSLKYGYFSGLLRPEVLAGSRFNAPFDVSSKRKSIADETGKKRWKMAKESGETCTAERQKMSDETGECVCKTMEDGGREEDRGDEGEENGVVSSQLFSGVGIIRVGELHTNGPRGRL